MLLNVFSLLVQETTSISLLQLTQDHESGLGKPDAHHA